MQDDNPNRVPLFLFLITSNGREVFLRELAPTLRTESTFKHSRIAMSTSRRCIAELSIPEEVDRFRKGSFRLLSITNSIPPGGGYHSSCHNRSGNRRRKPSHALIFYQTIVRESQDSRADSLVECFSTLLVKEIDTIRARRPAS